MRLDSVEEALEIKRDLHQKLEAAQAAGLPSVDAKNVALLIDAGEYRLALENLATQIYELDVELTRVERDALTALGVRFSVPVSFLLGDPRAKDEV